MVATVILSIIVGIIYANLVEYISHRYVLHKIGRKKTNWFNFHWAHHIASRREMMYDSKYTKDILSDSSKKEILSLLGLSALHLPFLLVSVYFFLTLICYMGLYFFIHRYSHHNPVWGVKWCRWHVEHHLGDQSKNFNVVFPLWDYILGTRLLMSNHSLKIALRSRKWF